MDELLCAKCKSPQMASAEQCSVCNTPLNRSSAIEMSSAPPENSPGTQPCKPILFPVSVTKFIVMDLATFGLYNIFWTYKSWKYYANSGISPGFRTWLSFWFEYSLFKEILKTGESFGVTKKFSPVGVFIPWLLLGIASRLPDPLWLVSFFGFVPLIPVLIHVNDINRTAGRRDAINSKFTLSNWIGIIVGTVLFVAVVAG